MKTIFAASRKSAIARFSAFFFFDR